MTRLKGLFDRLRLKSQQYIPQMGAMVIYQSDDGRVPYGAFGHVLNVFNEARRPYVVCFDLASFNIQVDVSAMGVVDAHGTPVLTDTLTALTFSCEAGQLDGI